MALHHDLLSLASRLVNPVVPAGSAVPAVPSAPHAPAFPAIPEAESRRAISTAYYALFHLLIDASTARGVSTADLRPHVARNFVHKDMLDVCKWYMSQPVDMTGRPIPIEIKNVADSFVQLQGARHKADYNVKDSVNLAEAQNFVRTAQTAFSNWGVIATTPAADTFLTELLIGGVRVRK
jgi:hypothetical protein